MLSETSELKQVAIFDGLSDKELADIAMRLSSIRVAKGARLFYRNDQSSGIYFVVRGSFQITIDNEANKEIIVYTICKGDVLGEMALFNNNLRSATAVALEDGKLYKISNEKFIEMMRHYSTVAVNFSRVLIGRLLAANEMIERLGAMDGAERVISFLRALMLREGVKGSDGSYSMSGRPTYQQISQRLGVSEKTIYRTVSHLVKAGKVAIDGRKLWIDKKLMKETR